MKYPIVTIKVQDRRAPWFGKWILNIGPDSIVIAGGPWNTEAEAIAAIPRVKARMD